MLALQSFCQHRFIKTCREEIFVRLPPAGEYGALVVNQCKDQRSLQAFVLGLDMKGLAVELNVCIKACDHKISGGLLSGQEGRRSGDFHHLKVSITR